MEDSIAERIQFDAPAGIVGLMVALNCMADVMATMHPPLMPALAARYKAKITELEAANEEVHKLAAKVLQSLLESLQQSPRAVQREPPAGSA